MAAVVAGSNALTIPGRRQAPRAFRIALATRGGLGATLNTAQFVHLDSTAQAMVLFELANLLPSRSLALRDVIAKMVIRSKSKKLRLALACANSALLTCIAVEALLRWRVPLIPAPQQAASTAQLAGAMMAFTEIRRTVVYNAKLDPTARAVTTSLIAPRIRTLPQCRVRSCQTVSAMKDLQARTPQSVRCVHLDIIVEEGER